MSVPQRASQVSPRTIWTVGLHVTALLLLIALLYKVRVILVWSVLALLLTVAINPAVWWLQRHRVGRRMAIALVFGALVLVMVVFVGSVIPMVTSHWQSLVLSAPELLERLQGLAWVQRLDAHLGLLERAREEVQNQLRPFVSSAFTMARTVAFGAAGTVTVVVLSLFMQLFGRDVVRDILAWLRPDDRTRCMELAHRAMRAVGGYVLGTLLVASIGGTVAGITLLVLSVPFFLAVALAVTFLGLIPFLGAWLGGTLVVLTTLATVGGRSALIALAVVIAYQQVENHLLQPLIQRRTMRMSPLIISFVLLVGTATLGILGALLALPAAGALQVLIQEALHHRQRTMQQEEAPTHQVESPSPIETIAEQPAH